MKHFYALADSFLGANPAEYSHGFANTKIVYAFSKKSQRDLWVSDTKFLGAKALTRSQALKIGKRGDEIYRCEQIKEKEVADAWQEAVGRWVVDLMPLR